MTKENEIKTNSTLTKCVVKPPGSCGAELTTIDVINFQKMAAVTNIVRWPRSYLGGSKQKIMNSSTDSYFEIFQLFFITKWNPWTLIANSGH